MLLSAGERSAENVIQEIEWPSAKQLRPPASYIMQLRYQHWNWYLLLQAAAGSTTASMLEGKAVTTSYNKTIRLLLYCESFSSEVSLSNGIFQQISSSIIYCRFSSFSVPDLLRYKKGV